MEQMGANCLRMMGLEGIYKKNAGNCLREPSTQHLASAFTI